MSTPETAARIAAARLRSSPSSSAALISVWEGRASAATRKVHERSTDCAILIFDLECGRAVSLARRALFLFFPDCDGGPHQSSFFLTLKTLSKKGRNRKKNRPKWRSFDIAGSSSNSRWFRSPRQAEQPAMSTGAARPSPRKRRLQSPSGERGKAPSSARRRSPSDDGGGEGNCGGDISSAPGTCPICGAAMKGPLRNEAGE